MKPPSAHLNDIRVLSSLMSLSGMAFGQQGEEAEAALGIPSGTLAKALCDTDWLSGISGRASECA